LCKDLSRNPRTPQLDFAEWRNIAKRYDMVRESLRILMRIQQRVSDQLMVCPGNHRYARLSPAARRKDEALEWRWLTRVGLWQVLFFGKCLDRRFFCRIRPAARGSSNDRERKEKANQFSHGDDSIKGRNGAAWV